MGSDTFVTKEREAIGTGQTQGKQGLNKEKVYQCLTSLQLPRAALLQPGHAALCCSSSAINEQNTRTIWFNFSPNPNHMWKKQALSPISENTIDFHPASFVVSVSQIFYLSLAKQQVPEKALSQATPRKVFSDKYSEQLHKHFSISPLLKAH